MNWAHLTYFISTFVTAAAMGFVALYTRRQRGVVAGAGMCMWMVILVAILSLLQGLSMAGPSEVLADLWWDLRFFPFSLIPVLWFIFVLRYAGAAGALSGRPAAALFIVPLITQVMVWSKDFHSLWVVRDVAYRHAGPFYIPQMWHRVPGVWFNVNLLYTYLLMLAGVTIIFVAAARLYRRHRAQAVILGAGTLVVVVGSLFPIFNLLPGMELNFLPQSFALGSLIIAWGLNPKRLIGMAPRLDPTKQIPAAFTAIYIVLATGMIFSGFLYYRHYRNHFREEVERGLSAIADMKVEDLVNWRRERMENGRALYGNDAFTGLMRRHLSQPGEEVSRREFLSWLRRRQAAYGFTQTLVFDAGGRLRIALPPARGNTGEYCVACLEEARRSGRVAMVDFFRAGPKGPIRLAVVTPVVESGGRGTLGFVVMVLDPATYLYPMIERWPAPSRTAESLLVRRQGDHVLFLNELRFIKNSAMNRRIPLTRTEVPAVMAVKGRRGIVEGIDYRGKPVVAALRAVPGSPWFLVARIDADEVYEPVRHQFWLMAVAMLLFVTGAGAGLLLLWRKQDEAVLHERLEAAEALRESEEKYRMIADNADDWVYWVDQEGRFRYSSPACERITGYSPAEFDDRPGLFEEIAHPEDRALVSGHLAESSKAGDFHELEFRIISKDGETRWISHVCSPIVTADGWYAGRRGANRDITGLKRAQEELRESDRKVRILMNNLRGVAYRCINDSDWTMEYISDGVMELAGYPAEDFLHNRVRSFNSVIEPEDRQGVWDEIQRCVARRSPYTLEYRIRTADGSKRWVWERGRGVFEGGDTEALEGFISDITERRMAEESLRASEERYRRTLDSMLEGGQIIGFDWQYLYLNDSAVKHGRLTKEEMLGRTMMEVYPGIEKTELFVHLRRCMEERGTHHMENQFVYPDDSAGWFQLSIQPVPEGLFILSIDITERKRAEEEVRRSEERFRTIIENINDVFFVLDTKGHFTYISPPIEAISGYRADEVVGREFVEFVCPEDLPALFESLTRTIDGRFEPFEFRTYDRGGAVHFVRTSSRVLIKDGAVEGITGIMSDITDLKWAERDLRLNLETQRVQNQLLTISLKKARLGELLEESMETILSLDWFSPDRRGMVFLADDDQRTLSVAAHCGIAAELSRHLHEGPVPFGECLCGRAAMEKRVIFAPYPDERHPVTVPGMARHRHYCVPILHEGFVLGVMDLHVDEDHGYSEYEADFLTAAAATLAGTIIRKQAEDRLEELFANLERLVADRTGDLDKANRELESFSYTVSHDLRAPLRHINGFLDMFKGEIGTIDNPRALHYMEVIEDSSRRMGQLIDDLLAFSRMGRSGLVMNAVDMNSILAETLRDLAVEAEGVEVVRNSALPEVNGDRAMLKVVVTNLLANAFKFSSRAPHPRVEVAAAPGEGEVVFTVRDNGVGFDMRYADKLFGVFQRLHSDREFQGTGIGLATVKRIIERHGGRVWAESEPGKGSSFYFTLPAGGADSA
ncbi:MAG: PAS domain S-box protein [Spirochaetes bacterium]|nr:PAS domain S-box protein [Spirochaetota bacterium]